jgi:hypothetical protein
MFVANLNALWDPETCVWIGTSDDVPGLVLETESLDAMLRRAREMLPELAEMNGFAGSGADRVSIRLHTREVDLSPSESPASVPYLAPILIEVLRPNGCQYVRPAKADQGWWFSPISERHFAVDSKIRSRETAKAIMKQAGLPEDF